jgi:hypothetical protein
LASHSNATIKSRNTKVARTISELVDGEGNGGRGLHKHLTSSTSEKEKRKEGEREEVATQPLVVPACFFALVSSTSFSLTKDLNIRYL